jgi:hypothetical protein
MLRFSHRCSHRFAAALVAALLLLAPLAVQAAPAAPATDSGWGAALLAGIENTVADGFSRLAALLRFGSEDPSVAPAGRDGGTTMQFLSSPDGSNDTQPTFDPNGAA